MKKPLKLMPMEAGIRLADKLFIRMKGKVDEIIP